MTEQLIFHQRINLPYRYTAGAVTEAFLRGLAEQTIHGTRCPGCGHLSVPARPFCPSCSGSTRELERVDALARLESWTVVTRDGEDHIFGLLRIGGADGTALHRIVAEEESLTAGMILEPLWSDIPEPEITAIAAWHPQSAD